MLAKEYVNIYSEICYLTSDEHKDWQKLLQYSKKLDLNVKRKFLWFWPSVEDLLKLQILLEELKISCLLSIGCGNGLLEWLIKESIGVSIYGLEIDRNWWQSSYAVQKFIELHYVEDLNTQNSYNFLQRCCQREDWNFALIFCYFNSREAFLTYLQMYKGHCVIIIGPSLEAESIHTDPQPQQPHFPQGTNWLLSKEMRLSSNDIIAFYTKF